MLCDARLQRLVGVVCVSFSRTALRTRVVGTPRRESRRTRTFSGFVVPDVTRGGENFPFVSGCVTIVSFPDSRTTPLTRRSHYTRARYVVTRPALIIVFCKNDDFFIAFFSFRHVSSFARIGYRAMYTFLAIVAAFR